MSNTQRPSAPVRHTVVEEGTEFKGALTSSCPIDVRGRIEGEVSTPALTVSATGAATVQTTVLMTPEEVDAATRKSPLYVAPGH